MALYRYVKARPKRPASKSKRLSFALMTVGFFMLAWTVWPILSFSTITQQFMAQTVSPVRDKDERPRAFAIPASAAQAAENTGRETLDFTDANNWIPGNQQKKTVAPVNSYRLSVPSLKIKDAIVTIAGDDLGKSLVHYGGTALPGQYGTAVIFGHSTLPQFYSPTNYKAIFSLLPTIKKGDKIVIVYDNMTYTYTIYDTVVVDPNDLQVLEQHFDDSYLTLVTCVPPGTYWKRLNVHARLDKPL